MSAELAHLGADGAVVAVHGAIGMACQHFWTTQEEVGRRQPLVRHGGAVSALFDGRIDNRRELLDELELEASSADAEIVIEGFLRWGEGLFERLLGPFVTVIHDRFQRRTVCARDPLGERTLCYYADRRIVVVASEEVAVLAHPGVPSRPDEESAARHFALASPQPGATFYADVRELPAGCVLRFDERGQSESRFWSPPSGKLRYRRSGEYAEHFRELLDRSVACQMRSINPPAVLMSGGLDSSAIAALAARRLARSEPATRLPVVSWIFDELQACDERPYMDAMVRAHDLRSIRILCDDAWPLRSGAAAWPRSRSSPLSNPYRRLLDRAYEAARLDGRRVLLTGWFGDHIYGGIGDWLADLVADGRLGEACVEWLRSWTRYTSRRQVVRPLRAVLARWLRRGRPAPAARLSRHPWLAASARALLEGAREPSTLAEWMVTGSHQWYAKEESSQAARSKVDVRHPFRDRRLVEFALSVPRYVLFRPGREKHVLREALASDLPPAVLNRQDHSSLAELFHRGLVERESRSFEAVLEAPEASWGRYVDPNWLRGSWGGSEAAMDGAPAVVAWSCLSWELWGAATKSVQPAMEVAQ